MAADEPRQTDAAAGEGDPVETGGVPTQDGDLPPTLHPTEEPSRGEPFDQQTDTKAAAEGPFGFRWAPTGTGLRKRKSQRDQLERAQKAQAGKPAKQRRPILKSVDVDVASNIVGAVWTMAGVVARLPAEVILTGTAITQSLAVTQSILAKDEDVQERHKRKKNDDVEG